MAVSTEAESIANLLGEDLTNIPVTKPDQPIQIWLGELLGSQKIYERIDFPKAYSELFQALQVDGQPRAITPMVLGLDNYTFCMVERIVQQSSGNIVSVVLAKENSATYDQIRGIRSWMILANFGAAILSFVAALVVSKFTLKPIQNIIDKAKNIKASEKMARLPVSSANDELTDLSETINEMITRIEQSIRNQNQFFASAAHELRTPLANMLSELELSLSKNTDRSEQALLESQREEVVRLKYVVQDFLLMSQLKADTLTLNTEVFRLDDLVYDILEKMKHSIDNAQFEVHFSIDESVTNLSICADMAKMESILVNLIQNALKFGDNQRGLSILISLKKQDLLLEVSNYSDQNKQNRSGNGLGLWICDQLARKQSFVFKSVRNGDSFIASLLMGQVS